MSNHRSKESCDGRAPLLLRRAPTVRYRIHMCLMSHLSLYREYVGPKVDTASQSFYPLRFLVQSVRLPQLTDDSATDLTQKCDIAGRFPHVPTTIALTTSPAWHKSCEASGNRPTRFPKPRNRTHQPDRVWWSVVGIGFAISHCSISPSYGRRVVLPSPSTNLSSWMPAVSSRHITLSALTD